MLFLLAAAFVLLAAAPAYAWIDVAWPLRRPIDVDWAADRATGQEIVIADFYTGGAHRPDGSDLRVTTQNDRLLPIKVLMVGPGDRVRVAFPAVKNIRRYYAYFGNRKPPPLTPEMSDIPRSAGLLMEMRELAVNPVDSFEQIEKAWQASTKVIGRTVIDHASLGVNPFGPQEQTISRFEGTFPVGFDGEYVFALSADDRAAVFIDGKPVVFTAAAFGDVRVNASIALKEGKHALVIYHVNLSGDGRFATGIRRAENLRWQALSSDVLGRPLRGSTGPLEQQGKPVIADFTAAYEGEAFFAGGYSHRYQFTARPPAGGGAATYTWDFGNGQTATGPSATQVYLADGVYSVRLTVQVGQQSDSRVHRIGVSRDWEWSDRPTEEPLERHALFVADTAIAKMPPHWLPRAALLFIRAQKPDLALEAARRLAAEPAPVNADEAYTALEETSAVLVAVDRPDLAAKLWQAVPGKSTLSPRSARSLATLQLWRQGDPAAAVKTLAAQPQADVEAQRIYGQALILSGKTDEGRKILQAIPPTADPLRHAAISGASARTVEYYITTGDIEAGEQAWNLWQQRYPADFLQGYAVMLKVQLLELQKSYAAAANVAEAFARAMPTSAYSPQLLHRARRLLADQDPRRSAALGALLKERHPEDPLAQ